MFLAPLFQWGRMFKFSKRFLEEIKTTGEVPISFKGKCEVSDRKTFYSALLLLGRLDYRSKLVLLDFVKNLIYFLYSALKVGISNQTNQILRRKTKWTEDEDGVKGYAHITYEKKEHSKDETSQ